VLQAERSELYIHNSEAFAELDLFYREAQTKTEAQGDLCFEVNFAVVNFAVLRPQNLLNLAQTLLIRLGASNKVDFGFVVR